MALYMPLRTPQVRLPDSMSGETRLIVMGLLERDATQRLGSRMQRGDTGVFDTLSQAIPCNVCVTLAPCLAAQLTHVP